MTTEDLHSTDLVKKDIQNFIGSLHFKLFLPQNCTKMFRNLTFVVNLHILAT